MKKHSSTDRTPPESEHEGASADALLAWLPLLAKAADTEDEPSRYASPPCYLAEFSDTDSADQTAK